MVTAKFLSQQSSANKNRQLGIHLAQCEAPPKPREAKAGSAVADNSTTSAPAPVLNDDYPNFSRHGPQAALPKYLTPELYDQLKHKRTSFGVTLEDMIQAGVSLPWGADPPRGVGGVFAGDAECYKVFASLLQPMIEDYHGVELVDSPNARRTKTPGQFMRTRSRPVARNQTYRGRKLSKLQRHFTNLDPEQILLTQVDPTGEYILYTRMRLARNLEGFAFAPAIARGERRKIENVFKEIVKEDFQPLQGGQYIPIMSMANTQHEDFQSRRICFEDPDEFKIAANLGRDWPDARGVYCAHWEPGILGRQSTSNGDKKKQADTTASDEDEDADLYQWEEDPPNVVMWCNYDDHIWIISVNKGGDVQGVFTALSDAVRQLELSLLDRNHKFSMDGKLGFLTSSPTNVGTALRASMSVKLVRLGREHPALFKEILERLHLEAKSDYAETDQRYTGIFDIANAERLGRTEVQWINIMIKGIAKLIELEKKLERGETVTLQDVDNVVKDVKVVE